MTTEANAQHARIIVSPALSTPAPLVPLTSTTIMEIASVKEDMELMVLETAMPI